VLDQFTFTVQPRPSRTPFAVNPAAPGEAEVPVSVTV